MSNFAIPQVLILSSTLDYSADLVTSLLQSREVSYLRIDRDTFSEASVSLDPLVPRLEFCTDGFSFVVEPSQLTGVFFRGPTFLRDSYRPSLSEAEQLQRTQWSAFLRSMTLFAPSKWMNNPWNVYRAEIKPLQLQAAVQLGFSVPKTLVCNHLPSEFAKSSTTVALKALDSSIIRTGENKEAFMYTNIVATTDLDNFAWQEAPIIVQQALSPKTDVRVTVIDKFVQAISILDGDDQIKGDWRKSPNKDYKVAELPPRVLDLCVALVHSFNLRFGAIDLAFFEGEYYFLEVNPTGEWGWVNHLSQPNLDEVIATALTEISDFS